MTQSVVRIDTTFAAYYYNTYAPVRPEDMHKRLESCMSSGSAESFLQLIDNFFRNGGDPNLTFSKFNIGDNHYRNVTCFQIVYLYWKSPLEPWSDEINASFEKTIDGMLRDERTDVRAKFTEHSLCDSEHFFNESLEEYYRQREEEGYLLEGATIAHYAMAIEDFEMVDKVLRKAPDLLHSTCCLMQGKNLLHQEVISVTWHVRSLLPLPADSDSEDETISPEVTGIERESFLGRASAQRLSTPGVSSDMSLVAVKKSDIFWSNSRFSSALETILALDNDDLSGEIAQASVNLRLTESTYPVTRITKVSLMHLAARLGNEGACGYFRGRKANFVVKDSANLTPFDYLRLSLATGFIPKPRNIKQFLKMLEPITRLSESSLPKSSLLLIRDGYQLMYDTRTRVASYAYERLTKESLKKNSKRPESGSFKVDPEVPELNRGKSADYAKSGFDKGHLVPAADAVASDKAMEDTFIFTNACPQNPELNQKYWKGFEREIRQLVASHDLIEVFTGCLFVADKDVVTYKTIGKGQTAVPTHLFKVLYLHKGMNRSERAYIMPNREISAGTPFKNFEVTVNKVQELSGILFNQWRA